VKPACEWRLPALPVLTYYKVRFAPAFAGRSSYRRLRSMKATAGVGRFSEITTLGSAWPESCQILRRRKPKPGVPHSMIWSYPPRAS